MKKNSVQCPHCRHIYNGHSNMFGKVCMQCSGYIPPDTVMPIVHDNEIKLKIAQKKLRQHLLEGAKNANLNRRNTT